jgi:MFS family permease
LRLQLALALARLFSLEQAPGPRFRVIDRQSLASIVSFLLGAFVGRIGDRIGSRTRLWLFLGTIIQALCLLVAGVLLWKGGQPSFPTAGPTWTNVEGYAAIAFASASMGLQGIMGKRVNTQFATTSTYKVHIADPRTTNRNFHLYPSRTHDRVV